METVQLTPIEDYLSGPTMAVFDFGKTNAKMLIFNENGSTVAGCRTAPRWIEANGRRVMDDHYLWTWMQAALRCAAVSYNTDRVMVSAHGCTFAAVEGDHLALPILDYEAPIPADIREAFLKIKPDFSETGAPDLPNGFSYGLQVYWMAQAEPEAFGAATAILPYAQFWIWRLTAKAVSEVSYLGCHSHLWAPYRQDFSSLVDTMNWREKMPPLIRAGLPVGSYELSMEDGTRHAMTVHNGVHDSNAAFSFYTNLGYSNFTLVSTGTWVVTMNTDAPYSVMDENRDMLTNVTVDKQPIATARFMGGREFDLISENARVAITASDIQAVIDKQQMALPSFADGGPFPGRHGKLIGPEANSARERAAIATLYLACMTNLTLDLLHSDNTVVIDGGLSNNAMYGPLINALRPSQTVLNNEQAEGTAAGAAALAFGSFTNSPFKDPCKICETIHLEGLEHYYERWRSILSVIE